MSSTTPERTPGDTTSFDPARTAAIRPFSVRKGSSAPDDDEAAATGPARIRHVVDRFDGAVGLLVLRLVAAAVLAIRGLQKLQHLDVTQQQFSQLGIPYANIMAVVVGVVEVAIAVALVLGVATRAAGLGIAVIAIGALYYVKWRSGSIFTDGQPGFSGELELLLAGVGIALAGLGGGGWGVDRRFRRR